TVNMYVHSCPGGPLPTTTPRLHVIMRQRARRGAKRVGLSMGTIVACRVRVDEPAERGLLAPGPAPRHRDEWTTTSRSEWRCCRSCGGASRTRNAPRTVPGAPKISQRGRRVGPWMHAESGGDLRQRASNGREELVGEVVTDDVDLRLASADERDLARIRVEGAPLARVLPG